MEASGFLSVRRRRAVRLATRGTERKQAQRQQAGRRAREDLGPQEKVLLCAFVVLATAGWSCLVSNIVSMKKLLDG